MRTFEPHSSLIIIIMLIFWISVGVAQNSNQAAVWVSNAKDSTSTIISSPVADFMASEITKQGRSASEMASIQMPNHLIHRQRLMGSSLALIALNYAAYQPFKQAWWQNERTRFHFYQGWRRTYGYLDFGWHDTLYGHMDKLGHYFSAQLLSEQLYFISRWIGFNDATSRWIGPILSSLLMLEIEIYDGFFKDWGFSLADFTANELGAFSPILRERLPWLSIVQLKFSYHPSHFPNQEPTFIKDYPGMTFWLAIRVHDLLPAQMKSYYPAWLCWSLGYSVSKPARGDIELFLAPDINWQYLPWGKSPTMRYIKRILNHFHFPGFALKFRPNQKFYPFYF
ncbi:MAG: YfiM family protein [candidate division KSB1 bacterium]|nr:YfiM family protein [candidate division KSB1 bacterium]MDZ7375090.1 YfiM family protein [candidate division KSB1 bacterium]